MHRDKTDFATLDSRVSVTEIPFRISALLYFHAYLCFFAAPFRSPCLSNLFLAPYPIIFSRISSFLVDKILEN